ncbi:cytochrome P450 [Mycobacterium spongiae]|uniref:Cytochrome P450 n=1 Tax=Mycobacterium spongiae TaxID=886343 RepID=A0A975K1S3_9MYCO|nr:cytochrome P450 [Mycobacterium spongiae]QUR69765.1 cytochrome P450 [Mycobacterium spongiae]
MAEAGNDGLPREAITAGVRVRWLAMHGFIRGLAWLGARRGDAQARLIADAQARAHPAAFIEELRGQGRLISGQGAHITVDHEIAHQVLRSDDFRVAPSGEGLPKRLRRVAERTDSGLLHPLQAPSLLSVEPPQHTRYRKMVSSVFTTRAVAKLRNRVEATAAELLDELPDQTGVVDIVERYCSQLPVTVIGDILGVPDDDREMILHFAELGAPSLDFGLTWRQYLQVRRGLVGINLWLVDHLQQLRRNPGDDLMSQLTQVADQDGRLDDRELQATAGLVLAAGFETTVNLLGNGIRMLLDAPQHLATLRARPELWPNAVEEILRLDSPVQMTARVARRDIDLAGQRVRRGQLVVVYLAGANRDPAVFDNPHQFDIERPNANKHLSFSSGRHFCLGAALARSEGEVGLRAFFERYPDAQLAGGGSRRPTRVLRGWSSLPVTLGSVRSPVGS